MSAEQAAAHGAAEHAPTASEYIVHHLQHFQKSLSSSNFLQDVKQTKIVDFSVFNFDSLIFSVVLGSLACFFLWRAASKATSGVPGRFQAAVEMLAEFVENQAKGVIHNAQSRKLVSPLAMIVFVWIFFLNAMDMLPVDLLPWMWGKAAADPHHAFLRVVPSADLSTTLGMSIFVLFMCLFYNVKIKGVGGWSHELIAAPFGDKWFLYPFNFAMQIIEFVAKTVSHGMRLFGNMFAGELVFMLIALMGGVWAFSFNPLTSGFWLGIGHVIAGSIWTIFHILIITLQAFIFMMLTLIYVGQAHDAH